MNDCAVVSSMPSSPSLYPTRTSTSSALDVLFRRALLILSSGLMGSGSADVRGVMMVKELTTMSKIRSNDVPFIVLILSSPLGKNHFSIVPEIRPRVIAM